MFYQWINYLHIHITCYHNYLHFVMSVVEQSYFTYSIENLVFVIIYYIVCAYRRQTVPLCKIQLINITHGSTAMSQRTAQPEANNFFTSVCGSIQYGLDLDYEHV